MKKNTLITLSLLLLLTLSVYRESEVQVNTMIQGVNIKALNMLKHTQHQYPDLTDMVPAMFAFPGEVPEQRKCQDNLSCRLHQADTQVVHKPLEAVRAKCP